MRIGNICILTTFAFWQHLHFGDVFALPTFAFVTFAFGLHLCFAISLVLFVEFLHTIYDNLAQITNMDGSCLIPVWKTCLVSVHQIARLLPYLAQDAEVLTGRLVMASLTLMADQAGALEAKSGGRE